MAQSVLGNVLEFLGRLGVFDVILPFLLVFSLVFALLEKTKVLGEETLKGPDGKPHKYPRKNLNAMISFVLGFLVVASSQLVGVVTQVSAQMVVLLFLGVFFLLLVGSFYSEGEVGKEGLKSLPIYRNIFLVIMFVGIIGIFLHAVKLDSGESWLEYGLGYIADNWSSTGFASLLLIAMLIGFVVWMTKEPKPSGGDKGGE